MDQILNLNEKDNKNKSVLLSLLFHVILILLLLLPCLHYFDPPRENQSIIVAVGVPEQTEISKSTTDVIATPEAKVEETKINPDKPARQPDKAAPVVSETVEEASPVVAEKTKSQEELQRERDMASQKEARKKAEAEARQKEEAKSKFGSLFNKNNDNDNSEGEGDPLSQPDATALEGLSEGFGKTGKGLQTRKLVYQPKIEDNSQKTGKVVVDICVNSKGDVISANYTQKGSTTTDTYLIRLAERNAKKYRFSESELVEQCGEIIIDFKLK